ncbi:MAG: efflux RND transporter periplasmic adaptor subunit, partial [Desulfobacterales bacterium]|nr:efflux RND transporter periplasmic adaptor subunit [Desulfobacterales bacterium]
TVSATGTLQPTNQVAVGSELSGIIRAVEVDYNNTVKVGQPLARLDTSKLEAQVLQAKATLETAQAKVLQARATVREASSNLERLKKVRELSKNKVGSQYDLDAAEAALERARAEEAGAKAAVAQAKAALQISQTDLSKAVIRSPINGIVLTRSVDPGQTVASSLQAPVLFTLAEDLTRMELQVDVDEADVGQVQEGQEATFTVDAYPDRTFQARITQVRYGARTVDGVVTYQTVLKVDNSGLLLRPGMTATADITVKKIENTVLVPNAALRFTPPAKARGTAAGRGGVMRMLMPRPPRPQASGNRSEQANGKAKRLRVWALRDGQLVAVPIAIGATDGTMTQVTDGAVEPGMALVVDSVSAGG